MMMMMMMMMHDTCNGQCDAGDERFGYL